MITYMDILRLIHIFSAIFWVGTTLFMVFFLEPVIHASGADGGKVMQKLTGGTRFSLAMSVAGLLTVFAGLSMYWQLTGFDAAVMFSTRLPLTLGSLAGILAAILGGAVQGRASGQMTVLGRQMAAQGSPPTAEQLATIAGLQAAIRQASRWSALLMVIAVIGMVM